MTQALGSLYRVARPDGKVCWVCIDHFREDYKAEDQQRFNQFILENKGTYDQNKGKVEIKITSKATATRFYNLLLNAKFVLELVIILDWKTSLTDFKAFKKMVASLPTILHLTVDCCDTQLKLKNRIFRLTEGTPATVLAEVMTFPGRRAFVIKNYNAFLSQV